MEAGGHGDLGEGPLGKKQDKDYRFWLENFDGLPMHPWKWNKVHQLRKLVHQLKVDSGGGVELQ